MTTARRLLQHIYHQSKVKERIGSPSLAIKYVPIDVSQPSSHTLTNNHHQVTKINWQQGSTPLVASGIEFAPSSGGSTRYNAFARREVIVAAGAIQVSISWKFAKENFIEAPVRHLPYFSSQVLGILVF